MMPQLFFLISLFYVKLLFLAANAAQEGALSLCTSVRKCFFFKNVPQGWAVVKVFKKTQESSIGVNMCQVG